MGVVRQDLRSRPLHFAELHADPMRHLCHFTSATLATTGTTSHPSAPALHFSMQTVDTIGQNEGGFQAAAPGVTPGREGLLELLSERGTQVWCGGLGGRCGRGSWRQQSAACHRRGGASAVQQLAWGSWDQTVVRRVGHAVPVEHKNRNPFCHPCRW